MKIRSKKEEARPSDTEKLQKRKERKDEKRGKDRKTMMDNDGQGNEGEKDAYDANTRERCKRCLGNIVECLQVERRKARKIDRESESKRGKI